MPQPRRRPELATGVEDAVPYDRAGLMGEEAPLEAGPPPPPGGGGGMDLGGLGVPNDFDPELGGDLVGPGGADLAPPDLGGLGGAEEGADLMAPEDIEVEQMAMALEDPNLPPEQRAAIEQQLALAARRQLAGLGG